MDGLAVTRPIRCDPACFDIPVIMVTGLTGEEDLVAAVEAGANDFITKPGEFVLMETARLRDEARISTAELNV